jgi:hypothetical protein
MQSKLSNYGRKQKPGKALSLTLVFISTAIFFSLFVFESLYSARLTEAGLRINTASQVTAYIETLSDNIKTIEQDVESLNPVPTKIVKQDLMLVNLIEKGTDSSMLDIDFTYIAKLRNYHDNLLTGTSSGNTAGEITAESPLALMNDSSSVDDALYQSFSGTQRSLETIHAKRASLSGALASIRTYKKAALISIGVFLLIYVMLTVVSYLRRSDRETEEFIPSKAAVAEHRIAS